MNTKTETYSEQKKRHSKEIGEIQGLFFAFSNAQLTKGLQKLNATAADIFSIGSGGFILKTEVENLKNIISRHKKERRLLQQDKDRLLEALIYELNNHEYCISRDIQPALDALGLEKSEVDPELLKIACRKSAGCE